MQTLFLTLKPNYGKYIECHSLECRKVIGFAFSTLYDWLKKLAPLFYPIRSKTKTNPNSFEFIFPRFASAKCIVLRILIALLDFLCPLVLRHSTENYCNTQCKVQIKNQLSLEERMDVSFTAP